MPAEPQQIACSAGSTRSRPGIESSSSRGSTRIPCAWARWHESWKATRSSSGCRSALGSSASSSETSSDAHVEPRVLQVRAAARGVDGDRVDAGEALGQGLRHPLSLLAPAGVEMERAAARLVRAA